MIFILQLYNISNTSEDFHSSAFIEVKPRNNVIWQLDQVNISSTKMTSYVKNVSKYQIGCQVQ